jgi:hypothetical protein
VVKEEMVDMVYIMALEDMVEMLEKVDQHIIMVLEVLVEMEEKVV